MLLRDTKPEEEGKYVELEKFSWETAAPEVPAEDAAVAAPVQGQSHGQAQGGALAEEEEAEMPPSFEYPFED